jgi:hypothetical protein
MNASNFDNPVLKAVKYFIYVALLLLFVILLVSGAFSKKEVSSDHIHTVQEYE